MTNNPYEAPQTELRSAEPNSIVPEAIDIEKLRRVAKGQKRIIHLLLIQIITVVIVGIFAFNINSDLIPNIGAVILFVLSVISAFATYQLAKELDRKIIAAIFSFVVVIPFFNWLMLFAIDAHATRYLKSKNIKVGFLGANVNDIH
jgi:hypothetical protein